jgi:hypothetical protein
MINNSMNSDTSKSMHSGLQTPQRKPNELGTLQFSSHVKISDPNTKVVLVDKRGDN